jgi:branched-chain amino acid transport system substrate-binding protein
MKKSCKWVVMVLSVLGLAFGVFSFPQVAGASDPGITKDQILIGAYLPYSSPANPAWQFEGGVMTYLNAINEAGGIHGRKIKWKGEDDAYQPNKTIAACKKLVEQDKIFALLSPAGIPTTFAVLPYLEKQNVPLLFPYAPIMPLEIPVKRTVFLLAPAVERQYYASIDYAIRELGAKRISLIGQAGPNPKDYMLYRMKQSGLSPVGDFEEYKIGQTDFSALVAKFKQLNPDFVSLGAIPVAGSLILKEAQKQGWNPQFGFMSHNVMYDEEFIRLVGNAGEGFRTFQQMKSPWDMDPEVVEFRDRLKKYYPKYTPSPHMMYSYVAARIFCEAMKKAGPEPTREKLITALESMTGADIGFMKPLTFSPTQHLGCLSLRVNQLQKGKYVPVSDWLTLPDKLPDVSK